MAHGKKAFRLQNICYTVLVLIILVDHDIQHTNYYVHLKIDKISQTCAYIMFHGKEIYLYNSILRIFMLFIYFTVCFEIKIIQ